MDYKLSKSEFYRVGYLLAGLFMFLFLFGIFSLNSNASAVSDYVLNITSSNGTFFETSGLYHSFSASLQHPEYAYPITSVSGSSSFTRPSNVESVNLEVHVVTSKGDFVVDTHQGTGSYEAFSSVKLEGYPIGYYGVCKGYLKEGTSSTTMTMNVSCTAIVSNQTTNVTNSLQSIYNNTQFILSAVGGNEFNIPTYMSGYEDYTYSRVNASFPVKPGYYGSSSVTFPAGEAACFNFPDYVGSGNNNLFFYSSSPSIIRGTKCDLVLLLAYYGDLPSSLSMSVSDKGSGYSASYVYPDDFSVTNYQTFHFLTVNVSLPDLTSPNMVYVNLVGTANVTGGFCFSILERRTTLSTYLENVRDEWDSLSPSVDITNVNTSQSMSDIGTAQTFETSAFSDFDTAMTSSGLDDFSLSFVSTPLLWCASIINTFYNNMPNGFQYLLIFVAFVGILVIVLNIAGRVVRRFGGD